MRSSSRHCSFPLSDASGLGTISNPDPPDVLQRMLGSKRARECAVYGLMECPIIYVGISVRDCVVYGLMECPIIYEGISVRECVLYGLMECHYAIAETGWQPADTKTDIRADKNKSQSQRRMFIFWKKKWQWTRVPSRNRPKRLCRKKKKEKKKKILPDSKASAAKCALESMQSARSCNVG